MVASRKKDSVGTIPGHLAVIMDGNGRWARKKALPRQAGHRAGINPVRAIVEHCANLGVKHLTLFTFSSENWQRPGAEIRGLMSIFMEALNKEVTELDENGIQLSFMGEIHRLHPTLQEAIRVAENRTRNNVRMELMLAVAYGGRGDLVNAARRLAREAAAGVIDPEEIDEARYAEALQMAQLPDVDLLIRTGGERRISNFLLWSLAYSELYFSDVLWPDFDVGELDQAFAFYETRQRRFGRTGEQVETAHC